MQWTILQHGFLLFFSNKIWRRIISLCHVVVVVCSCSSYTVRSEREKQKQISNILRQSRPFYWYWQRRGWEKIKNGRLISFLRSPFTHSALSFQRKFRLARFLKASNSIRFKRDIWNSCIILTWLIIEAAREQTQPTAFWGWDKEDSGGNGKVLIYTHSPVADVCLPHSRHRSHQCAPSAPKQIMMLGFSPFFRSLNILYITREASTAPANVRGCFSDATMTATHERLRVIFFSERARAKEGNCSKADDETWAMGGRRKYNKTKCYLSFISSFHFGFFPLDWASFILDSLHAQLAFFSLPLWVDDAFLCFAMW